MDLKRAWRNGFLVSLIFAIPLSDLYYNQYSSLIIDNSARETRVQHRNSCGTDTSCTGSADGNIDGTTGTTTSWDNNVDEDGLIIPGNALTDLLLESGSVDFGDIQKIAIQFDPEDIFQSEQIGEVALDIPGSSRQNMDTHIGSLASRSYGFGDSSSYAPGFSRPFMPALFMPGGKSASAGLRNVSGDNSETPFADPLPGSANETETAAHKDNPPGNANSGMGDESLHTVPEPSSLVLITIGTISVASLLYRKSKPQTYRF